MPQLTLNGARHYYRLEGDPSRTPLVLVHPIGADHCLWDPLIPHLLAHFHVLRYDLRGHGGSQATPGDYAIDLLANDLLDLTTEIGWSEFAVCGVSVGAMAAAKAAALAPSRIKKLVLCSAAPHMHAPPGGWDARAETARTQGMQPLAGPMVERMFSPAFRETRDPHIETLRTVFLSTDPQGYASMVAVLRDADLVDALPAIAASTLVLTGNADPLVPATASAAFLEGIRDAHHTELNAGHFPPVESPEQFASHLVVHARESA